MLSMTCDGVNGVGSCDVCGGCNLLVTNKTRMFGRCFDTRLKLPAFDYYLSTSLDHIRVCRHWSGHRSCSLSRNAC
jgi:hypothetical protein